MFHRIVRLFSTPDPLQLAQRELEEAQRELLEAQRSQEYYTAMVSYQKTRITRLNGLKAAVLTIKPHVVEVGKNEH